MISVIIEGTLFQHSGHRIPNSQIQNSRMNVKKKTKYQRNCNLKKNCQYIVKSTITMVKKNLNSKQNKCYLSFTNHMTNRKKVSMQYHEALHRFLLFLETLFELPKQKFMETQRKPRFGATEF